MTYGGAIISEVQLCPPALLSSAQLGHYSFIVRTELSLISPTKGGRTGCAKTWCVEIRA